MPLLMYKLAFSHNLIRLDQKCHDLFSEIKMYTYFIIQALGNKNNYRTFYNNEI